jgi:hypothetical protein
VLLFGTNCGSLAFPERDSEESRDFIAAAESSESRESNESINNREMRVKT